MIKCYVHITYRFLFATKCDYCLSRLDISWKVTESDWVFIHKRAKSVTINIKIKQFYVYWTVHQLDTWVKRDQLDVTWFIISLFNAQHVLDVLTPETCWALSKEIKQVTSSWSLFTQLYSNSLTNSGAHMFPKNPGAALQL